MSTTTIDLDEKTYGQLLGRTLPHVIHTDEESERLTNELLRLDERENPSPEEKELAELLTMLIDEHEERRYPIRKASPQRTLQHLMEARSLTQKDLWKIFGSKGLPRYSTGSAPSAKRRQKSWLGFSTSAQSCSFRELGKGAKAEPPLVQI